MATGDFNQDNYLDLISVSFLDEYLIVLLGNGDGTFREITEFYPETFYNFYVVAVSDLDNDQRSDIIVLKTSYNYADLFSGNGDGTFRKHASLYTDFRSNIGSVVIGDFNNDNYQDIAVINQNNRNVGVFLGHNNGTFEKQITSATDSGINPVCMAVGDFNSDNLLDVVVSYNAGFSVGIMFGYGNGSYGNFMRLNIEGEQIVYAIVVNDLNNDNYVDIISYGYESSNINVLLGDGSGHFQRQTILYTGARNFRVQLAVGDFNNDGSQDIVKAMDYSNAIDILLNTCNCCTGNS